MVHSVGHWNPLKRHVSNLARFTVVRGERLDAPTTKPGSCRGEHSVLRRHGLRGGHGCCVLSATQAMVHVYRAPKHDEELIQS